MATIFPRRFFQLEQPQINACVHMHANVVSADCSSSKSLFLHFRYGNIHTDMVIVMEFEWDLAKESENITKHGVTFTEAISSFNDILGLQITDTSHSSVEHRFFWIGKSSRQRVLTTRFTLRDETIRIIGCANWRKFRKLYYEAAKTKGH